MMHHWDFMTKDERITDSVKRVRVQLDDARKQGNSTARPMFKLFRLVDDKFRARYAPAPKPEWMKVEGCVNAWQVDRYHGESGTYVWVFPYTGGKKQLRKIRKALAEAGVNLEGYSINSAYDCTGQYFSRSAELHVCKGRVFVTQWWGMDV